MKLAHAQALADLLMRRLAHWKKDLNDYSHQYSPRKFTQPQLKVLLELRGFAQLPTLIRGLRRRGKTAEEIAELYRQVPPFITEIGELGYRKLIRLLKSNPELKQALELKHIPHYSTLARAAGRFAEKELNKKEGDVQN